MESHDDHVYVDCKNRRPIAREYTYAHISYIIRKTAGTKYATMYGHMAAGKKHGAEPKWITERHKLANQIHYPTRLS